MATPSGQANGSGRRLSVSDVNMKDHFHCGPKQFPMVEVRRDYVGCAVLDSDYKF